MGGDEVRGVISSVQGSSQDIDRYAITFGTLEIVASVGIGKEEDEYVVSRGLGWENMGRYGGSEEGSRLVCPSFVPYPCHPWHQDRGCHI